MSDWWDSLVKEAEDWIDSQNCSCEERDGKCWYHMSDRARLIHAFAAGRSYESGCSHINTVRKILRFSEEEREQIKKHGNWAPYTHQVVFCAECSRVVGQENNDSRKALSEKIEGEAARSAPNHLGTSAYKNQWKKAFRAGAKFVLDRIEQDQKENERLRSALERVVSGEDCRGRSIELWPSMLAEIARNALEDKNE